MTDSLINKKFAIEIAGPIGAGKSTLSRLVGEEFNAVVFPEEVKNNPILPLYYTSTPEEQNLKRYPFLLQLAFLNSRFKTIKEAAKVDRSVKDRTIWEDRYFAKVNHKMGRISDIELEIYEKLLENMMEEINGLPSKKPTLTIYLQEPFEETLEHIKSRGRSFELSPDLKNYYWTIYKNYSGWMEKNYNASQILWLDAAKYDVRDNLKDRAIVFGIIADSLNTLLDM